MGSDSADLGNFPDSFEYLGALADLESLGDLPRLLLLPSNSGDSADVFEYLGNLAKFESLSDLPWLLLLFTTDSADWGALADFESLRDLSSWLLLLVFASSILTLLILWKSGWESYVKFHVQ